ncbi:MAG: aminotransferase class I/II-fold pyridoxal phosphate-dependent enzyme [Clostridiaceae bacterium]|jgi:aspartate/methionine/tyrosine aminotransferase|nr:aminotransferase class I/II-fold pyridoxal phosphate-dependent enzyme [Clostridiaceae bacterium]
MSVYEGFSKQQLIIRKKEMEQRFSCYRKQNLKLDMSRGKPCSEQLDLSNAIFEYNGDFITEEGCDCRNYGLPDGISEMKKIFAEILGVGSENVIVGNSSSLNMMYDTFVRAYLFGINGCEPWGRLEKVRFLCPSPGYDRHFAICEQFNMDMITIPMKEDGPDMDMVEELVREDELIKGIWCIPMYSNPTGAVYSDDVVKRLAGMKTKAADFRIFWDNAYAVHHLYEENKILNILDECQKAGNADRVYMFASTAKITFAGSGVAAMASSLDNVRQIKEKISIQKICSNKINQFLHARFLKDYDGIRAHMEKHAKILRPKFEAVSDILSRNLSGLGIASWTTPRGGYFISLDVHEGCAKKVVEKAKEAGVTLTPAGATFPYGRDPNDRNIRIAPTYPPLEELKSAVEVLCICVELAVLEKILQD